MTLVLAGYYGVPVEKAEQNKREQKILVSIFL